VIQRIAAAHFSLSAAKASFARIFSCSMSLLIIVLIRMLAKLDYILIGSFGIFRSILACMRETGLVLWLDWHNLPVSFIGTLWARQLVLEKRRLRGRI